MKLLYLILCLMLVADSPLYADCIDGDCVDGIGTYVHIDGSKYQGNHTGGKREGEGTYTYPDGTTYTGQFKESLFNGQGTFTSPDGKKYEGNFLNGQLNGYGSYRYADGSRYEGQFLDDNRNGQGILTFSDGKKLHYEQRRQHREKSCSDKMAFAFIKHDPVDQIACLPVFICDNAFLLVLYGAKKEKHHIGEGRSAIIPCLTRKKNSIFSPPRRS